MPEIWEHAIEHIYDHYYYTDLAYCLDLRLVAIVTTILNSIKILKEKEKSGAPKRHHFWWHSGDAFVVDEVTCYAARSAIPA